MTRVAAARLAVPRETGAAARPLTRAVLLEVAWLGAVAVIYLTLIAEMYHGDAYIYWRSGIVGYPTVPVAGFVYPPPALLFFWPAHLVPYELFYAGWLVLLMTVMRWLMGPWLMLAFILPPVIALPGPLFLGWNALASGNVSLLIGAGIAYGVEHPTGWIVPALTKVTPAIGLGWLLLRREWRRLAISVGIVLGICAASFAIAPDLWPQWIHVLSINAGTTDQAFSITAVPPAWRIAAAAAIVALAAWRNAAWALPIAGFYAIGWLGDTSLLVMLGTVRLLRAPLGSDAADPEGVVRVARVRPV